MIATVQIADVGALRGLRSLATGPTPDIAGLRFGSTAFAAPLRGTFIPLPSLGRAGFIAFWDDEPAFEDFLRNHPLARSFDGGLQIRLEPTRAVGTWPGLPDFAHEGPNGPNPAVVLTLGRLRPSQLIRFRRFSALAEAQIESAEGLIWATALARPPLVMTCSFWASAAALRTYSYGAGSHSTVIAEDRATPFHHQSAFIRFRPTLSRGGLRGPNPLAADWSGGAVPAS